MTPTFKSKLARHLFLWKVTTIPIGMPLTDAIKSSVVTYRGICLICTSRNEPGEFEFGVHAAWRNVSRVDCLPNVDIDGNVAYLHPRCPRCYDRCQRMKQIAYRFGLP